MIEAKEVTLTYADGTQALKNVNFTIKPGELVFITGPSGSGKTSLLKLMIGTEVPTEGKLMVLGQEMSDGKKPLQSANVRRLRRQIGPVFQEFKLIKGRTALENVMMGMRFLGMTSRKIKTEAESALKRVGLEHKLLARVENLSWGEAQRVAIARAVARKPALILADEPTGNLDHENALNILKILTSFKDNNTAVVITTHATHLIEEYKNATFIRVYNGYTTVEKRAEVEQ